MPKNFFLAGEKPPFPHSPFQKYPIFTAHRFFKPAEVKERMKESLKRIESGKFAKDWLEEAAKGAPNLKAKREALGQHPVEIVGAKIRSLFERN